MGKIKKERVRRMKREGMHEIKNKWRSRAVNKRRRGLVLTPKKKRTAIKICASIASLVILVLGVFSIASMFTKYVAPNVVSDDFVTVNYDCPTDGSLPTDHSALENIGYLNNRFKKQTNWYLEMHGTTSTPVGPQSVNTFKQYSNGTMIMADVTSSGLVKAARQFCYVGNEVMWRLGSSYTGESFEAMQTIRWNTGEPYAHMTIENFKKKNGLPGTEMTVYIINEQTLLSADDVKDNGDGTYSQTYYLDPARDKAPAHYVNQMKFTGGLTDLPKFDYITVTFTFDEQWQLLAADVKEAYEATMGITVKCSSNFSTQYEYDTPKAESDAYETYFKNYVGKDIDDNAPEAVDAMNCLTSAFLTKPVTFGMTLDINGKGTKGVISLDASKLDIGAIMKEGGVDIAAALGNIGLKAQFGSVSVYLEDSTAYLSVGDLKAKLSIADLLEMITKKDAVATAAEITEADEGEEPAIFVIDNPETEEPNDGFTYTANESAKLLARLDLTSLGVGLVIPMSFEFKLDENNNAALTNASVNFAYGEIAAKIGLTESTETIADLTEEEKDAHIDLLPYAGALYESFKDGNLAVGLNYEGDTLGLRGAFDLSVNGGFALDGSITVIYNGQEKTVSVAYLDGKAYLEVDGIKVSADTKSAIALVKQIIEGMRKEPETQEAEKEQEESVSLVETVLTAVFEKDIASLISMTEADDVLEIAVKGTELLELFGVKFGLGDVGLTVSQKGEIEASAFGANVTLTAGGAVKALTAEEKAEYVNLKGVLARLPELLEKKALSLGGSVDVTVDKTKVKLTVNDGVFSFANGIYLYLDATLRLSETELNFVLSADSACIKVAFGNIGAEIRYDEIGSLGEAVVALYGDVRATLNPISETELLPEAKTVQELFKVLSALLGGKKEGAQSEGGFSLDSVLAGLTLKNSEKENGLLAIGVMGITVDVIDETQSGFLGISLGYEKDNISVGGKLSAAVYGGEIKKIEKDGMLGTHDFIELLDYVAAAMRSLAENNLNITLSGTIGSDDAEKYPEGVQYLLSGIVKLYSGEATAIHLNLDKKSLWVDADTYLYAKIDLEAATENDKSVYLELFVLDCDENGAKDGVLDAYVSVSFFKEGDARRNPLTVYAPATELMPVLSSALALLGVDQQVISDYVISPWISDTQTVAQLKGFGKRIMQLAGNMLGGADGDAAAQSEQAAMNYEKLIESIKVGATQFEIALSQAELFGKEGAPLTVTIGKEQGANGTRLTAVSLANIGNTSVSVAIGYEEGERTAPTFKGTLKLDGIASLLQTLARSTTHEEKNGEVISGEEQQHSYVLNENFYVDGSIQLDINAAGILKEKLNIKVVAFSITVDENGVWGVNVRFEYDAMKVIGITAINGNTQVDLTGKDNMVYIKRVQTTDADGKPFAKPVTVYRAMPLSNFVGDMIGQMGFLFNLGSKITDLLGGIDMSGSGSGSAEAVDIGTTVSNILKSIDYQRLANGESWTITLNGAGLTNGTLGDIVIALGSDAQGKLRTLTAHTSLSTTGISMAIDANLTYHNPCGVMDAGVKDITTDIAALLTDGMSYKLSVVDWTNTKYIEGEYTSVEYVLMGEVIKKQDIVISTGAAGDAKGTVYGTLSYPDLTPYQTEKGYRAEWTTVYGKDDPLPESRQIFAQYKACTYRVTFALDGETVALDYLYGSADFELPFREDAARRIAYFVDEEGNEYRTAEDMKQVASDCTLTAVYEEIEYTIVFDLGDEKIEQKAHFGDTINYPEQPERTGYAFAGWDTMPETVSGDTTLTALWTANRYEITFVSKYEIEGYEWTADENGSYVTTFEFAYGSTVALPQGVRAQVGDKIYTLRGFCTAGDAVCYFEKLPNVTEDTLFTAQWEELGFDIVFVGRDGAETVLNYHAGEVIPASAIPTIPARDGYESAWKSADGSVIGGDYKVTGEARFAVVDTAKTYAVTVVGSQPYEGFTPADGNYVKTYSYVYDGAAVTLEPLNDIHAYWFKGYYTQADGAGERVEKVEGILEDTTVYVWWQDNAVTVNVYSDIRFEGSTRDNAKNGFYKQYTFRDNYGLDDSMLPKLDGYQTLALWHRTESGFERVTDVRNLNGEDLWVLWIKNIKVSVNDLYMTDYIGGKHYNIAGTVEGGTVFGNVSLEIFKQMNGSEKTTAIVDVTGANASDKYGNLDWGGTLDVQYGEDGVGSFSLLEQNCSNYAGGMWGNTATYGGAIIIKTFTLGNETVTTYSGSFKSIAKYSVVYRDANGKEIGRDDNARAACPFPYVKDGVSYECSDRTFADELAKKNGIAVPQKAGYTGVWAHDEIRGAMDVYPVYTANQLTSVRFESDRAVEGFRQEGDVYVYECEMQIGSLVSFFYDNKLMADAYTIVEGRNVITLPALTDVQKWGTSEIKADSANLYAQRNVDMIIYSSNSVAYTYDGAVDGATYLSFSQEVTAGYTMLTPKANGYRFLGWYREVNGAWEIVTSVSPTEGEEKVTTTVYALWLEDLTITEYSTTRKDKGWGTFEYVATVRVSGGRLYGTPYEAGAVTLQENMSFYYYVDGTNSKKDLGTNSYAAHKDMDSITNTTWQKRSRSHVRVTSTYEIKGYDAITVTLEQACDMTDI